MKPFFSTDEYHTPAGTPRLLGDRLSLNTRYYFLAHYIGIVIHARYQVVRGQYDGAAHSRANYRILRLAEGCGGRFHITGLNHIRAVDGPVVFASNHMGNLESSVFACLIYPWKVITYVVKTSLLKYPIFGPVLGALDPIPVHRTNPREDFEIVMREGVARLENDISIVLYPQGTRTVTFEPEKFNSLGVKLARRANVPLIPVAVKSDFWGNGKIIRDFGPLNRHLPIHIAFGEPLVVDNTRQVHHQVIDFIQTHLDLWTTTGPVPEAV